MEWKTTAKAILALTLTVPAISTAEPAGRTPLAVRVFDVTGISDGGLRAALSEANAVLARSGLDVSWIRCAGQDVPAAACDRPVTNGELLVRVFNRPMRDTNAVTMGYALVDPSVRHSLLASVYWNRVLAVANRADIDPMLLLGRVIAHEIGHLLLNTNHHSPAGLMRADWSQTELRLGTPADWRFDEAEARAMRASLMASR
jgi:hypothetical protein